jgi:hypothetical protein
VQVVQAGGSTGENSCHHSVHFVVNSAIGEHDGHLDDAVEAGPGGFTACAHVPRGLPVLLRNLGRGYARQ